VRLNSLATGRGGPCAGFWPPRASDRLLAAPVRAGNWASGGDGALRVVRQGENESADTRVGRSDPGLASRLPALVIATRGGSGHTYWEPLGYRGQNSW
jgi:hypothetical protein